MDRFSLLTLGDKNTFDSYLAPFNSEASELSFTNLYMWRRKYRFHHGVFGRFLWVLNVSDSGRWYFSPPLGDYRNDLKGSIDELRHYLHELERPLVIKKAHRTVMDAIAALYPSAVSADEARNDFDYVYDFDSLKTLKGNAYHKKRNHVNKFMKTSPDWAYQPITTGNTPEVLACLDRWCDERDCRSDSDLFHERLAIEDALENRETLGFNGGLIRVGGAVEAFTLAEQLNPDTTVIHIEKANARIDGLYAAMNQLYLENCPQPTKLVNREQDMGIENLRKAKESYHPVGFVEKYTLTI